MLRRSIYNSRRDRLGFRSSRLIIGSLLSAIVIASLALPAAASAQTYASPGKPAGYVSDFAGVIPAADQASLESTLSSFEQSTGIEIAVATTKSLGGDTVEDYAARLFQEWGIGNAKKDNGILILVAPSDRQARIEVGYGLEGTMTDALSSVIIQSAIIPKFKAGDFAGGASAGVDAIIGALTVDAAEWQRKANVRVDQQPDLFDQLVPFIVLALFVFVFVAMIRNARGQSGKWVRRGGQTIFIPSNTGSWGDGWGGGSSSGGDFGGGGFSGGGGSSGGGGASGSW